MLSSIRFESIDKRSLENSMGLSTTAEKMVKLNLGARDQALKGFINIDLDKHEGVDVIGDASDLSYFADGAISEIYASHILEHFPHTRTLAVLKEWNRVLVKGGILYVGVPDFRRTVELYLKYNMQDWIVNSLWGDQGYKTAFHYTGFDFDRLASFLEQAGFSESSQVDFFPFKTDNCSDKLDTIERKPVSLNVIAIK